VENAIVGECNSCEVLLLSNDKYHTSMEQYGNGLDVTFLCEPCAEANYDWWADRSIS